jgi:hypothetical protein
MKPKSLFYRWLERVLPYLLAVCAASGIANGRTSGLILLLALGVHCLYKEM